MNTGFKIRRPSSVSDEFEKGYVLPVEFIPKPSWYINVRTKSPTVWDKIKKIKKRISCNCEICGKEFGKDIWNRQDIHEVFSYNTGSKVQKLVKLESLCHACHMAKHPGFMSTDESPEGISRANFVIKHSCRVNKLSSEEYDDMLRTAYSIWEDRSKIKWEIDLEYAMTFVRENSIE